MKYLSALGLVAALASVSYAAVAQTPSASSDCTNPSRGQPAQAEQSGVNNGRTGQLAQAEQSGVNNGRAAGQLAQNLTGNGEPCR